MQAVDNTLPALGERPAYTSIGCYPIVYYTRDGLTICAECANRPIDEGQAVIAGEVYWEGPPVDCEDCGRSLESAYGDPDEKGCENPGRYCKCQECQDNMADIAYEEARDREGE
jgi:hypothetical protein